MPLGRKPRSYFEKLSVRKSQVNPVHRVKYRAEARARILDHILFSFFFSQYSTGILLYILRAYFVNKLFSTKISSAFTIFLIQYFIFHCLCSLFKTK